ncbi:MAG: hypothetical protein QM484_03100 [Woeseiaceae bacterium]
MTQTVLVNLMTAFSFDEDLTSSFTAIHDIKLLLHLTNKESISLYL